MTRIVSLEDEIDQLYARRIDERLLIQECRTAINVVGGVSNVVWTTMDGRSMKVGEMTSSHVANTLKYFERVQLSGTMMLRSLLEQLKQFPDTIDVLEADLGRAQIEVEAGIKAQYIMKAALKRREKTSAKKGRSASMNRLISSVRSKKIGLTN